MLLGFGDTRVMLLCLWLHSFISFLCTFSRILCWSCSNSLNPTLAALVGGLTSRLIICSCGAGCPERRFRLQDMNFTWPWTAACSLLLQKFSLRWHLFAQSKVSTGLNRANKYVDFETAIVCSYSHCYCLSLWTMWTNNGWPALLRSFLLH